MGSVLEEPGQLLEDLKDAFLPSDGKGVTNEAKSAFIRKLQGVNWGDVLAVHAGISAEEEAAASKKMDAIMQHML